MAFESGLSLPLRLVRRLRNALGNTREYQAGGEASPVLIGHTGDQW